MERNGGGVTLAALAAILLLGLGLRVGEAWNGRAPVFDAAAYAKIAANVDEGNGYTAGPTATQPSSDYSPGLPLLAAGIYELSGGVHERLARVILAFLGTLSILFAYLLARRLRRATHRAHQGVLDASRGAVAGLVAAGVVAIYPALLEYQGMLMGEPLAATLLAGAVLATLWAADGRSRRWVLPGLLFGALALVRPEYLAVAVLVALLVGVRELRAGRRIGLAKPAILLGGLAIAVAPWTIRNAVELHRFVPVSTGGGQVLFAGSYLPSGGDPERVGVGVVERHPELFAPGAARRLRLEQILARLAAHRHPRMETDEALAKMGRERLEDAIGEEPLTYAGFVAAKVGRIWAYGPRDVMRQPAWALMHWLLLGFGLLGLAALAARRRWEALLLATVFLAVTAISAVLVASPRRVLVTIPLVAALAGVGALACRDSLARWQG